MQASSPLEEFQQVEPLASAPLKAGSAYFLINRRWYTAWLQWVGHPSMQSPKAQPAPDPHVPPIDGLLTESPRTGSKRTRAISWTKDRPGQIDNSDLLEEGSGTALKRNLDERSHYEVVPEEAWKMLQAWYGGGPPIKRRAIQLPSGGVQVELFGLQLKVHKSSDTSLSIEVMESKCTTIKEFKTRMCAEMGLDPAKVRIWDYFNSRTYALLEKDADKTLESCRIYDQNPIMLEEQNADGSWPYKETPDYGHSGTTSYGYSMGSSYTSSADVPSVGEPVQRGAVGLQNLGNTCFMNSSIQCLSNVPPLREFFLSEEYKESLNRSAYKTQGKLAEGFAGLLSLMWREDTLRVAPRNFKWQVGQFAEQFSGYGQQDSMELIEYVLDGLKEDLNLVQGAKPYTEVKEADGRSDDEVAAEAMSAYRKRSNSRVDDLFVGLFKSIVRCPEPDDKCGRVSVTFDPFLSVKLPLVSQTEQRQATYVMTVAPDHGPMRQVRVKVGNDESVKALIEAVAKEVEGLRADRCVLAEIWNKKVHKFFEENEAVSSIRPEDTLLLSEVASATAFQVSSERRWGSSTTQLWSVDNATNSTSQSESSFCGLVIHHRQVRSSSTWTSYTSYSSSNRELLGLPVLLAVAKRSTCRQLCAEVARHLRETGLEPEPDRAVPSWKLFKVDDKWSPTSDGTLVDPSSDASLELQDSREYFAIEWDTTSTVPSRIRNQEAPDSPSGSPTSKGDRGERDLHELLAMFVEDERLGPDDAWYCNRCKDHKEAWKKLEFHQTPPILVVQLKRFQYTRWSRERLNVPVNFPLEGLDLAPYCTSSAQASTDTSTLYDLAGLSKHIGSLGGGHYVAYCRSSVDGCWYNFDDGLVQKVPAEEVEADKVGAYVLFYIRRDYRPANFGPPPTPSP